jgi:outer membrane lipoprotein-sorting protein
MQRVGYKAPQDNGVTGPTLWFDKETWLQVGSYLTGANGQLIGRYAFLEIELNSTFDDDTFTRAALTK